MRRYGGILMAAAALATAIGAVGCNHPLLPKTPPTISAASLGTSQWGVLGQGKPVLGVDLYVPQNYPAATVQADGERTVAYIKNTLKADAIGIVWNFYSFNPYNASITANADTLSASNVAILTRIAQQHHLQVEYRPIIQVMNQPNNWSGLISPYPESNWFNNYFKAELPYLKVAQELKVPEFVAGTELYRLNNSSLWPSFFNRISRVYHGIISYSSWDGSYFGANPGSSFQTANPALLPAKYLGMDMYWHMNLPSTATSSQVTAEWENLFGKVPVSVLHRTAIDETGIQARTGAYSRPEDLARAGTRNEDVQANWFTAACATVKRFAMRGVFFFKVDLADNPEHPATSLSTFEGREGAEAVTGCVKILR
jgi:hypothetical protein